MYTVQAKTIVKGGKVVLFSVEEFKNKVVKNNNCFICGVDKNVKIFNEEHILPKWLLKEYNLYNQQIVLTNTAHLKYGQYKISCCKSCNSELGKVIEEPISRLWKLPYKDFCNILANSNENLFALFKWLSLIYFKTYFKDSSLNWHLDKRKEKRKISDNLEWSEMHHLHCIIRSHFTKAIVNSNVIGSIFIFPAIEHQSIEPFDFVDSLHGKGIMIRMNQICVMAILNDSCGTFSIAKDFVKKINGPLTPLQLRDMFSHLIYINMHLAERPTYYSEFKNNNYFIEAKIPKKVSLSNETITRGNILFNLCKDMFKKEKDEEIILSQINDGGRQFLFNEKGKFFNHLKDLT
ncbi:MAG: hypothetical protein UT48_C0006G0011 [Parcubacteria group bacterium GW2011_GWE2_39_37]|uniref:Uncharacterized protein n=1 Tax=Candidatus Falkowbacteria bacterium GW2011_GWF2_39_8 TaxID=1618642 RepID=A0A0G0T7N9_9BACT|nr:MAG: hypothetical protein UT48_C0006G0011 [Parcubacteria group bacterium GW2011_GWE2_39_37]KKR33872.1 MAG: hypothetical protein UT64_C0002G0011 [Candidatus Falkowbacteria bacterium GW2011_GWF2_39_8]